jgi:hypothetical protein
MDGEYMWRWYGCDRAANPVVISARSFFQHADAVRDLDEFLFGMNYPPLAA